jgi:lysophospholipase L1-like esterase
MPTKNGDTPGFAQIGRSTDSAGVSPFFVAFRVALRIALWCAIAVVTLECCARLDDWISYGASPFGLYDHSLLEAFDQMGQHGRPYGRYLKWHLNSLGFRGPELDPSAIRILCVGSSETFGQYETDGHEWPRELERLLNQRATAGIHYQLVNTGFSGETFPTSLLRLPSRLQIVKPRFVLLYPSLAHYLTPSPPFSGPPPLQPKFRWRMQARIENTLKTAMPMWLQIWLRRRDIQRAQGGAPQWDNMPLEYQKAFSMDLEKAIELIRQSGAEPVLITHANRFKDRVDPSERFMLVSWQRFYPMLREDAFLKMEATMNGVMRQVAQQQGVLLVDVAEAMPSGPNYFGDFVHFTDQGSAAFSRIVAEKLEPSLTAWAATASGPMPNPARNR